MKGYTIATALALLMFTAACTDRPGKATDRSITADGKIIHGLRVITLPAAGTFKVTVFRGDYIVIQAPGTEKYTVSIPALKISKDYPVPKGEKKYIKMKKAGTWDMTAGDRKGSITVTEYSQPHYRAVSAKEAREIIANINPLVLDVRTPMEYRMMRIAGSRLLPIQELQAKVARPWQNTATGKF